MSNQRYIEILTHMLGAGSHLPKKKHGYRNYFCAAIAGDDFRELEAMLVEGLVRKGHKINEGRDQYFFATLKGCELINLSPRATRRAMEDQ